MFNKKWNMNIKKDKNDNKFYVTVEGVIFNKRGYDLDYDFCMELNKFLKQGFAADCDIYKKELEEADTIEKINDLLDMIASEYEDIDFNKYLENYKCDLCQEHYEYEYMWGGNF